MKKSKTYSLSFFSINNRIKKITLVFFWTILQMFGFAAVRTISTSGGNYNSTSTWVEGVVPTLADDVVATSGSGPLTVNVASSAKTFNLTNYASTLTMNANLSVYGAVTLASGMTYAGTSDLICLTTATLTSNGVTVSGGLQLNGTSQTYTLADNWTITGLVTCTGITATTVNGNTLYCNGGYTQTSVTTVSGTTNFVLGGGSWTSTTSSNVLRNNLSFAGNVTLGSNVAYNTGTLTYTSGTITTTGSTLICALGTTFNCNGFAWNNVILGGASQTYTLNSDLDINGLLTCNGSTATTINGAYNIKLGGGYTQTTVPVVSGTATFVFDNRGTWTSGSTLVLKNNLTFNSADTIFISPNVAYNTGTITHTAGYVSAKGSTLTCTAGTTFNCSGIAWNNVVLGGTSQTFTLSSDLDVNGLLTCNGTTATTVNGAYNVKLGGGYTQTNVPLVSGTATFLFDGKGTWNGGTALVLNNNVVINTTDTLFIGTVAYGVGTFTYTAGKVITTGSTLRLTSAINFSTGIDLIDWNNLTLSGTSQTYGLNEDLVVSGTLSLTGTTSMNFTGSYHFNCANLILGTTTINLPGYIVSSGSTTVSSNTTLNGYKLYTAGITLALSLNGTTCVVLTGGTWNGGNALVNNTTIDGDVTLSGTVYFGTTSSGDSLIYNSGTVNVAGSTIVIAGMNGLLTGTASANGNVILKLGGISLNNIYFTNGNGTVKLLSNMDVNGYLHFESGGTPSSITMNGYTATIGGNLTSSGGNGVKLDGSTNLIMDGKGTLSIKQYQTLLHNLTFNTSDTITVVYLTCHTGTITYVSGTIISQGSTLSIGPAYGGSPPTLNTSGMKWYNVVCDVPVNLTSDINIAGNLTLSSAYLVYYNGAYTYNVEGSLSVLSGAGTVDGYSTILMKGKGTLTSTASNFLLNLTINTSDTITFGSVFNKSGGALTYQSGTIVSTGSTYNSAGSAININNTGFGLNNFVATGNTTFGGSQGCTIQNLTCNTPGVTLTFAVGNTYEIAKTLNVAATSASRVLFKSSVTSTSTTINLVNDATEDIAFANFTDVVSTKLPVWTYKGTITRCTGISQLKTEPRTVAYTF